MKKYNTQAIVLKNIKYKDSDKIFTLFTKDYGKLSALARGVRKISSKRAGNLDTLNLVSISIREGSGGIKNIEEAKTLDSFKSLKKDLQKSIKAYYIAELVHKSIEEGEESPKIFNLLVKSLKALEKNGYKGDLFISFFEINLLKNLGYELTFDKCRKCRRVLDETWKKYIFDVDNGSIECERCSKFGVGISKKLALNFSSIAKGNLSKDILDLAEEADKIMKIYIGRKLESRFKSLEIEMG